MLCLGDIRLGLFYVMMLRVNIFERLSVSDTCSFELELRRNSILKDRHQINCSGFLIFFLKVVLPRENIFLLTSTTVSNETRLTCLVMLLSIVCLGSMLCKNGYKFSTAALNTGLDFCW